jgi:glycogen debranching enzyme
MIIMNCVDAAREVLLKNTSQMGTKAGDFYPDIWCRDALISSLGMSASGDEKLLEMAKTNIDTVASFQKANGQVPNKISTRGDKACFGEGGCVDSSLWYSIAALEYYNATKDQKFLQGHVYKIEKALYWAHCLDVNNDYLIETPEGSDWMDLLLRSGRVLYDNVLFYGSMKAADRIKDMLGMERKYEAYSRRLRESINLLMWPRSENLGKVRELYGFTGIEKDFEIALRSGERRCYLADLGFRKFDPRFDVFANILAIFFDVAGKDDAKEILGLCEKEKVYEPYPIRVLAPPIFHDDQFRNFYFRESELPYLQEPGNYHNGGAWPFAGGFYVAALKKLGRNSKPMEKRLVEANELGGNRFSEWISSFGEPAGSANQTWSAAMLIYAMNYKK